MGGCSGIVVVFITTKDEAEAARIAYALVEKRLAACCNIVRGVRSIYCWQGQIADENEVLLMIKTRGELFPALSAEVQRLHSYTVPEIIAVPLNDVSPSYRQWLIDAVQ